MPAFDPGVNSYVTLGEADSYFEDERPNETWTVGLSDEEKQSALMYATEYLDASFSWRGVIEDETDQTLGWPRYSARDHENRLLDDSHPLCDSAGIPLAVKNAACEVAVSHFEYALNEAKVGGASGEVRSQKIGPMSREFFQSSERGRRVRLPFVRKMLRGVARPRTAAMTIARQ